MIRNKNKKTTSFLNKLLKKRGNFAVPWSVIVTDKRSTRADLSLKIGI